MTVVSLPDCPIYFEFQFKIIEYYSLIRIIAYYLFKDGRVVCDLFCSYLVMKAYLSVPEFRPTACNISRCGCVIRNVEENPQFLREA